MEYQYWTIKTTTFFLYSGDKDKGGARTTDIGMEIQETLKFGNELMPQNKIT